MSITSNSRINGTYYKMEIIKSGYHCYTKFKKILAKCKLQLPRVNLGQPLSSKPKLIYYRANYYRSIESFIKPDWN